MEERLRLLLEKRTKQVSIYDVKTDFPNIVESDSFERLLKRLAPEYDARIEAILETYPMRYQLCYQE